MAPAGAAAQNATSANPPGLLGSSAPGQFDSGALSPRPDPGAAQSSFEFPGAYPPGFGAGTTGFVSTGTARRNPRPKPGAPAPAPRGKPTNASHLPNTPIGAPGLRPVPQLGRQGAPAVEDPGILVPPPAVVTLPRHPVLDPVPFDALGLRAGSFLIKPAVELTAGYDSNPQRFSPAKGSPELLVAPELTVRSDWERNALNADIHGSYLAYTETFPTAPISLNRPALDAHVTGRLDISHDDQAFLETRMLIGTDYPGSPNITAGLAKLPIVTTYGATIGYLHDFNRLEISTKTTIDRSIWGPATFTDGTTIDDDDRNLNQYGEILRGSYEVMPGVRPFVEASIDTRIHDIAIDRTGADRDSEAKTISAGTSFDFSGRLTGEISVGQTQREFKDASLPNISGVVFDSSLVYAASPLTTMKFNAISNTGELIVPGASGVLRRDFIFDTDHDFRRWLTGGFKVGYGADSYFGLDRFDNRYTAGVFLIYRMSRELYLRGEYRHEWMRSSVPLFDYDADIALLTVRLQR
jgi:hypothetical protein